MNEAASKLVCAVCGQLAQGAPERARVVSNVRRLGAEEFEVLAEGTRVEIRSRTDCFPLFSSTSAVSTSIGARLVVTVRAVDRVPVTISSSTVSGAEAAAAAALAAPAVAMASAEMPASSQVF